MTTPRAKEQAELAMEKAFGQANFSPDAYSIIQDVMAGAIDAAVAETVERCAKIVDEGGGPSILCQLLAAKIRERGATP